MAIAIYSESELQNFSALPRRRRLLQMARFSIHEALIFRRNIQISMAKYAEKHRQEGAFDPVIAGCYSALHDLETLARRAFVSAFAPRMRAAAAGDAEAYKRARKSILARWEKLFARSSY